MPSATATTISCRMLNEMLVVAAPPSTEVEACSPRMLVGISPVRKAHQSPTAPGAAAASSVTEVCLPGCRTTPSVIPMLTAINAVIANQIRVCPASRAALPTPRRLAMLAMIAVRTSGTTRALRSETNEAPMVSRVLVSQLGLPSSTGPSSRATSPRTTPSTRPARTCAEKGTCLRRASTRTPEVTRSRQDDDGRTRTPRPVRKEGPREVSAYDRGRCTCAGGRCDGAASTGSAPSSSLVVA